MTGFKGFERTLESGSQLKFHIASEAAGMIVGLEVGKIIEGLKKEIEENGLDAVQKYFPHTS